MSNWLKPISVVMVTRNLSMLTQTFYSGIT